MSAKKLYFIDTGAVDVDVEACYTLDTIAEVMDAAEEGRVILIKAQPVKEDGYFYCRHFAEVSEHDNGTCGKHCAGYTPRNGRTGACKHFTRTLYEPTDRRLLMETSDTNRKGYTVKRLPAK